jgi:putative Mg2+ transporter-C (MgtC) family protein
VSIILQSNNFDPGRIVGQIVTGIGFLGAGVILTRQGVLVGITSASVIWILAGIGILIGFEKYAASILVSILTVGILHGVTLLEKAFKSLRRGIFGKLDFHKKKNPITKTHNSILRGSYQEAGKIVLDLSESRESVEFLFFRRIQ